MTYNSEKQDYHNHVTSNLETSMAYWAIPLEFHTPPVEDRVIFKKHLSQEECEFKVDKLIWHLENKRWDFLLW